MPRDGGGFYTLPAGNPVVPGTIIESDWANPTMEDIKAEMSDSLSRSGKGGMLAALRGPDGSAAVPTFSFTNEPSTGRFRDGPGQIVEAVDGTPVVRYLASGLEQWDANLQDWVPLTPRNALGTPFDPAPSNLTSTNVQDAIEEVNGKTGGAITADSVTYDDSNVYFAAATVQIALDAIGFDIPPLANDILDNADAIQLLDGDMTLAEQRITLNEANIGSNTNAILILDGFVQDNTTQLDINSADISSIKFEQITQNDRLTGAEGWTQFNWGEIQSNTADITTNSNGIATNTANIASNLSKINSNTGAISSNTGLINTNTTNIGNNSIAISNNTTDISANTNDLATVAGWFNNTGVLQVLHGGTGVTTKSGTGAGVHTTGPEIWNINLYSGEIWTDVLAATQDAGNNSRRIATTAFVQNAIPGQSGQDITTGATAHGRYMAVYSGSGTWRVTCWSEGNWPSGGVQDRLPITHQTGTVQIATCYTGIGGQQYCSTTTNISGNTFDGYGLSISVRWISTGEATYSAAFKDKIPTDRYYNKATQTEHLEIMHGDWTLDPDVVILPPSSPFWGAPMGSDEELTFDGAGIPLARVARVKPQEELLRAALVAAGINGGAVTQAVYLDGRGVPGPLNAIDAALDAIVLAESVTLEVLTELM